MTFYGPLVFGYDPQNEPEHRPPEVVRRLLDLDGLELVVLRDEDGDEWIIEADDYNG